MDDDTILSLFQTRSERAIAALADKYGHYCQSIAMHILHDTHDADECVNESYFKTWNAIPPQCPKKILAFVAKIVRNTALDFYTRQHAAKRGGTVSQLAAELDECIPDTGNVETMLEHKHLVGLLNRFVGDLPPEKRHVFLRRYWFGDSISELSAATHMSKSKVKSMLFRVRQELRNKLEAEGVII